jgi:bifunctional DNase/RNase
MDKVKLSVKGISASPGGADMYVLTLGELGRGRVFPQIITFYDAQSIAYFLDNNVPDVAFSHDLFFSMAVKYGIEVIEVFIRDFENKKYKVDVLCYNGSEYLTLDARLADAVAIALRFRCPIFTTRKVLALTSINMSPEVKNVFGHLSIEELSEKLAEALKIDDYETAIAIRDEINKRKKDEY